MSFEAINSVLLGLRVYNLYTRINSFQNLTLVCEEELYFSHKNTTSGLCEYLLQSCPW